jgi:hypothetical protein
MKRVHHHRTPTEKEQGDGWGREEEQGKRGRRRRWIGGGVERETAEEEDLFQGGVTPTCVF